MTRYYYTSLDARGDRINGWQESPHERALEISLKQRGLDLILAKPARTQWLSGNGKIKRRELISFFFNLEQLSRAGVPLLEALGDLRDSMETQAFREVISRLIDTIENGKTLSQAMAEHPRAFDSIAVNLTQAGEQSGCLPEIFQQLADALTWQDDMATQTQSILIYPLFAGTVISGVTLFMMIYLVPQLVSFMQSAGQALPWQTRLLLAVSSFLVNYWAFILLLPPALWGMGNWLLSSQPLLRYRRDRLLLKLWLIGPVQQKIILARFANTFALMYRAGINILDCLGHSQTLLNNQFIARSLEQVIREIEAGQSLTRSFQNAGIFPPLIIRMLKVGETTGRLDQVLLNVSHFYERDAKQSIHKMQRLIEPAMTLVLGVLLGWIMLAVLAPVYEIISKVNV